MKKYICFLFFLLVCLFSFSFSYADAVTSAGAVYQTFVNHMQANNPTAYTNYLTYKQGVILRLGLDHQYNYNSNNNNYTLSYWKTQASNNNPYPLYVFVSYKGATIVNYPQSIELNGVSYGYNIERDAGNSSTDYFILFSDGHIENYINKSFYNLYWNTVVDDGLVWSDFDIYEKETGLPFFANTKNQLLSGNTFSLTGYETGYQIYTKLLDWMTSNNNYYINVWALGNKPTCAIFRNYNNNVVATRINSYNPSVIANEYLAVFYPDRLCEYIQNNNSSHFNLLSLAKPLYYILFDTDGNINFYFMGSQNSQNDVALLTDVRTTEIKFCNSNIIAKSSVNDFILNDNDFTYSYVSESENETYFPISPVSEDDPSFVGPIDIDLSSIENYIDEVEDKQTSILNSITNFFSTFWDNLLNRLASLWETSTEAVQTVFQTFKNSISQFLPIRLFNDFTGMFENIMVQADLQSRSLDPRLEFTFLDQDYSIDFLYFYKIHKNDINDYIKFFLILSCAYYNINQMFVVLGSKKIF